MNKPLIPSSAQGSRLLLDTINKASVQKPAPIQPGAKVRFEYQFKHGYATVLGTVLEPSQYTRAGEVRVCWDDAYGVSNVSLDRVEQIEGDLR